MQSAAMRMRLLVESLLNYARTTEKNVVHDAIDLTQMIAEIQEEFNEELHTKAAVIRLTDLTNISGVTFQLRQLFYNLISNAIKFSHPDRPLEVSVTMNIVDRSEVPGVHGSGKKSYHRISIEDNGIGFETAYSRKIFDVFQRLHGPLEYDGTGIGLSIVKKVIDNHKGYITATGTLDKGAVFNVYLPVSNVKVPVPEAI